MLSVAVIQFCVSVTELEFNLDSLYRDIVSSHCTVICKVISLYFVQKEGYRLGVLQYNGDTDQSLYDDSIQSINQYLGLGLGLGLHEMIIVFVKQ